MLFQFFIPAESATFPLPEQAPPAPDSPNLGLETGPAAADRTAVAAQPDPSCASNEDLSTYFCQIQAVETQAGFDARELPFDPAGMEFTDAKFDFETNIRTMAFEVVGGGGVLYLHQGTAGDLPQGSWDKVPAKDIQQVTVNGQYAEMAAGAFVAYPDASDAAWKPDASLLRLRWREGDH